MARVVLVVEDADPVAALEIALSAIEGIAVTRVPNGRAALEVIRSNEIELAAVITDLNLPFVDGFEVIKAVREQDRYAGVPIFVVSGDSRPDTPQLVSELGATVFFSKPYSPVVIRDSLEELLHVK